MRAHVGLAGLAAAVTFVVTAAPELRAQSTSMVVQNYGRAEIDAETRRSQPGGVLAVTVRNARWADVNTLLDGRRATLAMDAGTLFGLVPVALDTQPADHKLSLFFPGGRGRGGATNFVVPITAASRPSRTRTLTPEAMASAASQTALGHGRFLLSAIRSKEAQALHSGPLHAPVEAPINFPFGGAEDFGAVMGPVKDGLIGEHHRGVDYEVPAGTVVRAPGNGIVLMARSLVYTGETVVIGHGRGLVSVLGHLSHVSVREGDMVNQGTAIGISGKTGIGAFAPHVCFSVYLHSLNVDPEALMDVSLFPAPVAAAKH